ncbi:iron permease FTR1 family-domain-containing protein [Gigaspora rosea]|uniref:Iron permease FTR1 family-domain-containing protein n=1 Tax=Gigaspora rosea TaxID=44941 RepID=A0A397UBS9_9GLOM
MVYLFDIPAYFIILRETLEVTIILAVLLGFLDKLVPDEYIRKQLKKQLWIGSLCGFVMSLLLGGVFIAVFYTVAKNLWEESEDAWEGAFSLIATVVITLMALTMIRVQHWKTKWENKLQSATNAYLERHNKGSKWALILLPFTVILREALESIVFIAGIGYNESPTGLPIPVITGIITGFIIGWLIYRGSHTLSLNIFFVATTVLLLFIAAGLFTSSVDELLDATGGHSDTIWELNCCSPKDHGFWSIMNAIFGWRNEATVATTVSYFVYWIVVIIVAVIIKLRSDKAKEIDIKESTEQDDTTEQNDTNEKGAAQFNAV